MSEHTLDLKDLRALANASNLTLSDLPENSDIARVVAKVTRNAATRKLPASLPDAQDEIAVAIGKLSDREIIGASDLEIARAAIKSANLDAKVKERLGAALEEDRQDTGDDLAAETAAPELALRDLPDISHEMRRLEVAEIAGIAGFKDNKIEAVLERVPTMGALDDQRIGTMVIKGVLTKKEAERLGVIAGISQLAGSDVEAVKRIASTKFTALRGTVSTVTDILKIDDKDLGIAVVGAKVAKKDPDLALVEATSLRKRIEAQFPNQGIKIRLSPPPRAKIQSDISQINKQLAQDPALLDANPDDLDLKEAQKTALRAVQQTVNSFPGLDLRQVATSGQAAGNIAKKMSEHIAVFDKFLEVNTKIDFLNMDYAPDSKDLDAINFDGLAPAEQVQVMTVIKARARTYRLTQNTEQASQLISGGFHSAIQIGDTDAGSLASRTGLEIAMAGTVVAAARDVRLGVSNLVGTLLDELRWRIPDNFWVFIPAEDITDGLKKLTGYEDLFGSQSYCDCGHCDSILSPAAYFVDLMSFVDENITKKDFTGAAASHALKLQVRRPDLWKVPLSCDNTHTLIPTLEVINEILENALAARIDAGINIANRAEVHRRVYDDTLSTASRSFITPFDTRVASADRYITDFDTDRAEIQQLVRPEATVEERNAAALSLSMPAYRMITTPNTSWSFLNALYSRSFAHTGALVTPFNVQKILGPMDISREDFGELVTTRFVTRRGTENIRIKASRKSAKSIQNDVEKVSRLTNTGLDRMQRFLRLKTALNWGISTLDLAIDRLGTGLGDSTVAALVAFDNVAKAFDLNIDEAIALSGDIPEIAVGGDDESLMDRLFNQLDAASGATPFPAPGLRFIHPGLRDDASLPETGPDAASFVSQRLQLGLGLGESGLLDMIVMLAPALGIDPAAALEADRGFALTADALALLFRHAVLADKLDIEVDTLSSTISIATGGGAIQSATNLRQFMEFHELLSDFPYELEGVLAQLGLDDAGLLPADEIATSLISTIETGDLMSFAPTVFAFLDGVSEDQSRAIVGANNALFDPLDRDMLRLKSTVDLTPTVTAPASGFPDGIGEGDLQAALEGFNIRNLLPTQLAVSLDIEEDKLEALLGFANVNLTAAGIVDAFYGGPAAPLASGISALSRPVIMFGDKAVHPGNIAFAGANAGLFGLAGNPSDPAARDAIYRLGAYVAALQLGEGDSAQGAAVDAVLAAHTPATAFAAADMAQLARACGAKEAIVQIFSAGMVLPDNATLALDHLRRTVSFASQRGLGADAMALLASSEPDALGHAAETLVSALRLKINDEESFATVIEAHEDFLRGKRRNALVDYLIRQSAGRFTNISDIYAYYLIDPEMEGCARTSRVVSAIGSVQTYVHRVLLNLEQDRRDADAANHVHVSPSRVPQDEWDWRKNYRVWEANRKVFLWPENYMQPALRDNKTPLFKQLEQTLMQQDINEQTIQDAYGAYLKGFEDVANLRIAGAYHEHSFADGRDVLHVFGCTADDPPTYYYWTVENLVFAQLRSDRRISYSARQKIDLSVSAREVSPIIYNNRLHLFWVELATAPNNVIEDGESKFRGYRHTYSIKFSALRLDGSWAPPQTIKLGRSGTIREGGLLIDPLTMRTNNVFDRIPAFSSELRHHSEYREGYTLNAPAAMRVYPANFQGELYLSLGARHEQYKVDMFERVATRPGSSTRATLQTYWDRNFNMLHIRNDGGGRRFHHQSVNAATTFRPAPVFATQDYVKSWGALRKNIFGAGWHQNSVDLVYATFNLAGGDISASVAAINDDTARLIIPNSDWPHTSMLVQKDSDISYMHYNFRSGGRPYESRRLGTTLATDLSRTLFYDGVAGLLAKETQKDLKEKSHLVTSRNYRTRVAGRTDRMNFKGPLGTYYREIFMYIPALLAAHQNARGDYGAAQAWYAKIFDPTADFADDVDLSSLTRRQRKQAERNRVWQYVEFEGLRPASLRKILTDEDAQEAYRKDPFNPYAIARLRLSAFQKNIVMRYVDNLIDWGDSLFRQFQRETVDEAHVLYDLARQILGPRPADVGDCGEGVLKLRTYEKIKPHMEKGQDFLIEVETSVLGLGFDHGVFGLVAHAQYINVDRRVAYRADLESRLESKLEPAIRYDAARIANVSDRVESASRGTTERIAGDDLTVEGLPDAPTGKPPVVEPPVMEAQMARFAEARKKDGIIGRQMSWKATTTMPADRNGRLTTSPRASGRGGHTTWRPDDFVISAIKQVGPAFCVPRNKDLLALWDRVEDRLYKIHNCLNIDGERVDLALFAPEIDPNALVRARAAGLSLSDILGSAAGNLPPYRFSYLVGKARDYVGLVQSFGSKLQSAIEKRDSEELALLRLSHAANMQNMVTKIREYDIDVAKAGHKELLDRQAAVEYRKGYYDKNLSQDLLPWERAQQVLTHGSTIAYVAGAVLGGTSGVLHLIPQIGSPFAMKYGGHELGHSLKGWSKMFSDTAKLMDVLGKSVSVEAKFERRRSGWKHQVKLDEHELKQIEKRIIASEIRVQISEKALENHKQAILDHEEVLDFYESKFSGLDLYIWLAGTMQGLYRSVFNAAHGMAKLAEAAYRFERPHDNSALLELSYWESGKAGLLAGERLVVDLIEMEKRFIETNYRKIEISQPFSVMQIDPAALMSLKETGSCDFTIPEFAYDLLYPGQYRRRIKSVRLSVACVTGPYVNIPATLMLTGSMMRTEPTANGAAGLVDSELRHTVSIATSTAQSDAGVFDFSFSDPRYMPFEGAGAVESQWRVTLPKNFRPFDYDTINDVILHISYTAESDGVLREHVESENAALEGALTNVLSDTPLPRVFSFRQEFSTAFHMLRTNTAGVAATVTLSNTALPLALQGRNLSVERAILLLKVADGLSATGTEIIVNATTLSGFTALPDFPGFVGTSAAAAFAGGLIGDHIFTIGDAGDLAPADPAATGAIAEGALEDMMLYVEVSLG